MAETPTEERQQVNDRHRHRCNVLQLPAPHDPDTRCGRFSGHDGDHSAFGFRITELEAWEDWTTELEGDEESDSVGDEEPELEPAT